MTARALIDLAQGAVVATVDIRASRERIFEALTTDEVVQWWGSPEDYRTTGWHADVRIGGAWRAEGQMADGRKFSVGGLYIDVVAPLRVVKSWEPDWEPGLSTQLSYTIDDLGGGRCRLTVRHTGFGERRAACEDHGSGWERVLGWLARHFA